MYLPGSVPLAPNSRPSTNPSIPVADFASVIAIEVLDESR
jgi:hypothetical protein